MLIVWCSFCYIAESDKSDAIEGVPDQLLKRAAMVFRVHSRHVELLLTYWCSQSMMIVNFGATVCNNWTSCSINWYFQCIIVVKMFASATTGWPVWPCLWPLILRNLSAMLTHIMNICVKFHWNPSMYRDIALRKTSDGQRKDSRKDNWKTLPLPHIVGGGRKLVIYTCALHSSNAHISINCYKYCLGLLSLVSVSSAGLATLLYLSCIGWPSAVWGEL